MVQNPVSVFEIFHTLQHSPQTNKFIYLSFEANISDSESTLQIHMPYYLSLNIIQHYNQITISIQDYCSTYIHQRLLHQEHVQVQSLTCTSKPLWLALEIPQDSYNKIQVSLNLHLPQQQSTEVTYSLRSIIYFGSMHFTSRFLDGDFIWQYDGQSSSGKYISEMSLVEAQNNVHILRTLHGRQMSVLFYVLDS